MEDGAPTHYMVVEGLAGEGSIWRVVRAEEHAKGRRLYAFVGTCQTRRAALSLARALNEKRAVDEATLRAAALRGQSLPPGRADIAPCARSLPAQALLLALCRSRQPACGRRLLRGRRFRRAAVAAYRESVNDGSLLLRDAALRRFAS